MKIPLKLAKFIFKRELKIIIMECQKRCTTCGLRADLTNSTAEANYLRGKSSAYDEMGDYLENKIIKINELIKW